MNRDLFLGILNMDSYNRGYSSGISNLPITGLIGRAAIRAAPEVLQAGWQAAGFYAITYNWNGKDVIVFRGSDETRAQDILLGYPTAIGNPLSVQAAYAVKYAREVMTDTIVSGHSLGGGLAANDNSNVEIAA